MAVVLPANIVSIDDNTAAPIRSLTVDVAGTTVSISAKASDIAALTIPGSATLTMSQP